TAVVFENGGVDDHARFETVGPRGLGPQLSVPTGLLERQTGQNSTQEPLQEVSPVAVEGAGGFVVHHRLNASLQKEIRVFFCWLFQVAQRVKNNESRRNNLGQGEAVLNVIERQRAALARVVQHDVRQFDAAVHIQPTRDVENVIRWGTS